MPPLTDPVRVAVIGAGFISEYHINGLRAAGRCAVTTLVGRRADKTAARAAHLKIPSHSTDYQDVLADPDVDAVVIATPDASHKQITIDALQAKKPVLLQKPMAMTSQECREILAVQKQTASRLTVSFMHRYFPEVRWLKSKISQNAYGKIHFIRMRNATPGADWADWFYKPDSVAGGVVMQLGVHGIDLTQHLFGPISDVMAFCQTAAPIRTLSDNRQITSHLEDNTLAAYQFAAGHGGSHEMSFTEVAGCDRFRLEVYFENATVWLRSDRAPALVAEGSKNGVPDWQAVDLPQEPLGKLHHAHWLDVVRGLAPIDDTPQSGLSTIVVAEHIYQAARESSRIKISDKPNNS